MKHVTHRLDAWLGGELTASEAEALTTHLDACADCAAAAARARRMWDLLGAAETPVPSDTPSVWDAVRRDTLGTEARRGMFGAGRWLGGSLATAAVAAGLVLGLALPSGGGFADGSGGSAQAAEVDPETYWLTDTSWGASADGYGLAADFFDTPDDTEGDTP